jgi:EpsI family protein
VKRWPLVLAVAMLAGAWLVVLSTSRAEARLLRKPFAEFPLSLGGWQGQDLPMDEHVLALLKLTDYLMRGYVPPSREVAGSTAFEGQLRQAAAPVWLYVGYYGSQRTGATYHSPKNCLPGGGWQFRSAERVRDVIPGTPHAAINKVVIEKGFDRQMILYWYQDRGRTVADEYAAKVYLIWDAMTRNRTDGALIRISTPVVGSEDDAYRHAAAFLRLVWPPLREHLPG